MVGVLEDHDLGQFDPQPGSDSWMSINLNISRTQVAKGRERKLCSMEMHVPVSYQLGQLGMTIASQEFYGVHRHVETVAETPTPGSW